MMHLFDTQGPPGVIRKAREWLAHYPVREGEQACGTQMELAMVYAQLGERCMVDTKFASRVHRNECERRLK